MSETGFAPEWLALRESADAAARSAELADQLRKYLNRSPLVVRDLGCGTGSMGRWLTGRLAGEQHWVLHDRDPRLLELAGPTVTGPGVTVETRQGDLTALRAADLAGTSVVTASALLDLLTEDEVGALAGACAEAGCAALLTLSVAGRIEFDSPELLDTEFQDAFNAHQRRTVDGRRLLGPDAAEAAVAAFERAGMRVSTRPSPWRLGSDQTELTAEWLRGWVGAAVEQDPDLAEAAPAYLARKLAGEPHILVHHTDLLALPGST